MEMPDAIPSVQTRVGQPPAAPVLVADDDVPLAHFLRRGLQNHSYDVRLAHDGEATLEEIATTRYGLLILDLNLPKIDGMSLLRRLRPIAPNLPVLVLSARTAIEDRIMALDSGADDYMVKPFSFQELAARSR